MVLFSCVGELCRFDNRQEFVEGVRDLRLRELSCDHRMTSVRCGLASVVPLQLLNILTPTDLDLRVCGVPDINLDYLRVSHCCLLACLLARLFVCLSVCLFICLFFVICEADVLFVQPIIIQKNFYQSVKILKFISHPETHQVSRGFGRDRQTCSVLLEYSGDLLSGEGRERERERERERVLPLSPTTPRRSCGSS